jgi:hypothetical protein
MPQEKSGWRQDKENATKTASDKKENEEETDAQEIHQNNKEKQTRQENETLVHCCRY